MKILLVLLLAVLLLGACNGQDIVDLSRTLKSEDLVEPTINQTKPDDVPKYLFNSYWAVDTGPNGVVTRYKTGNFSGAELMFTNVKAPAHMYKTSDGAKDRKTIDQYQAGDFVGNALVIKFEMNKALTKNDVEKALGTRDPKNTIVLLNTGVGETYSEATNMEFYNAPFPELDDEALEFLIEKDIKAIGTDARSLDNPGNGNFDRSLAFLDKGKYIVSGLINLNEIESNDFFLVILAQDFKDGIGAPARVLAFKNQSWMDKDKKNINNVKYWYDIGSEMSSNAPTWPGESHQPNVYAVKSTLKVENKDAGVTFVYRYYKTNDHMGSHVDAPIHFEGVDTMDKIKVDDLVGNVALIDVSDKFKKAFDYEVTDDDMNEYEEKYGRIADGSIAIMRSGFYKNYGDYKKTYNSETPMNLTTIKYPGWGPSIAPWIKTRKLKALLCDGVSDSSKYLGGNVEKYSALPFHTASQQMNKYIVDYLGRPPNGLDVIPPVNSTVFVGGLKIADGTGSPSRIFLFATSPSSPPPPIKDDSASAATGIVIYGNFLFLLLVIYLFGYNLWL